MFRTVSKRVEFVFLFEKAITKDYKSCGIIRIGKLSQIIRSIKAGYMSCGVLPFGDP
jgi:hypothetical protein